MDSLFRSIKTPKADSHVQDRDLFSQKEIKKIVAGSPKHVGLFVRGCYNSAARISELLSVKLKDCKEDKGDILARITGKGGRERALPIGKKLFAQIRKHVPGKTFLFESPVKVGQPYNRRTFNLHLQRIAAETIGRHMHPHALRHSRITHLLDEGVPLAAVSRFAGHARVTTTVVFYAHNSISQDVVRRTSL